MPLFHFNQYLQWPLSKQRSTAFLFTVLTLKLHYPRHAYITVSAASRLQMSLIFYRNVRCDLVTSQIYKTMVQPQAWNYQKIVSLTLPIIGTIRWYFPNTSRLSNKRSPELQYCKQTCFRTKIKLMQIVVYKKSVNMIHQHPLWRYDTTNIPM